MGWGSTLGVLWKGSSLAGEKDPCQAQTGSQLPCFRPRWFEHLRRGPGGRRQAQLGRPARSRTGSIWRPKAGRNGGNFACRWSRGQRFCGFARTVWRIASPPCVISRASPDADVWPERTEDWLKKAGAAFSQPHNDGASLGPQSSDAGRAATPIAARAFCPRSFANAADE